MPCFQTDNEFRKPDATTAAPGHAVYVEGLSPSTSVGRDQIIWQWTEDNQSRAATTNYYTVFSLRLFGDLDFDNDVDATDRAAVTNLTEQHGWNMPVASNTLRKVELKNDVLIPGYLILSLTGDAQVRIWTTATPTTNDTPLLITGQTVTNGIDGANFVSYPDSMIYVEAISSGTASLTYSYVGTDSAEGYECGVELALTAANLKVEFITGGLGDATNALHVAKWEQAFTNGYIQVSGHTFTNALFRTPEFISADSDRFQIRVTDESLLVQDTVTVLISTEHPYDTTYNTPQRVLELQRTAPGVFASTNLLLVSDWEDFTVSAIAYGCSPDTTNRTFLSQLGGDVRVEYRDGWNMTNIVHATVGSNTRTVTVDVAIMRTNGVNCIDSQYALTQVCLAKERMAQADIAVELGSLSFFDAPSQVDLDQWQVADSNNYQRLSQDALFVLHEALISVTNATNNICFIFVPNLRGPMGSQPAGHATASYWYVHPYDAPYVDHCLISVSKMGPFVSAHELCHALNIRFHETETCNLMFATSSPFNNVDSSKRLFEEQVLIIRAEEQVQ